jgi:hypothetical protein
MNKPLLIRWYRLDVDGQTCTRCAATQETLINAVRHLKEQLDMAGWNITIEDVKLSEDQIEKSNLCELNGRTIEEIIDLKVNMNSCSSCSDLTGKAEFCRSVIYKGKIYDAIPYVAIVDAILTVSHLKSVGPSIFL